MIVAYEKKGYYSVKPVKSMENDIILLKCKFVTGSYQNFREGKI